MAPELRKVQQIVAKAKKEDASSGSPRPAPWRPWAKNTPPADVDYLHRLNAINMRARGRNLYQDEAKWARRLRVALEGMELFDQLWVVDEYYRSERFSQANRAAWDGALAYKPWISKNALAYECALIAELVPIPPVFATPDMDERLGLLRGILVLFDETALRRYNELPTYWSGVAYGMKPSDYMDSYPARLNPQGTEPEVRNLKGKAIMEVGKFWLNGVSKINGPVPE